MHLHGDDFDFYIRLGKIGVAEGQETDIINQKAFIEDAVQEFIQFHLVYQRT